MTQIGFGWMWMLLLLAGTIALAVWLIRLMFPQGSPPVTQPEKDLLDTSRRYTQSASEPGQESSATTRWRYTKGEISCGKHEARKEDVEQGRQTSNTGET